MITEHILAGLGSNAFIFRLWDRSDTGGTSGRNGLAKIENVDRQAPAGYFIGSMNFTGAHR